MSPAEIDQVALRFDRNALLVLNGLIGLMMYGMALDLRLDALKRVFRSPRGPAVGLIAQFLLLPAFTFLLTLVLPIAPSLALGMILVAACPGGNLSNLMTYLAGGNIALSVGMTAISTAAAILLTPLNLALWGALNPATAPILETVHLDPLDVLGTVALILGLPVALGVLTSRFYPRAVERLRKPLKLISVVVFVGFVLAALVANGAVFWAVIGLVAFAVFVHNALALALGYGSARLFRLPERDRRAVAIEVGIQNSALALVLIFDFFDGRGGMAIVAAWWGVWHIVAGLSVAAFWSRRLPDDDGP